jgi:hypothetical protein
MTEFDDRLRRALDADDEEFLRDLEGERGLFDQLGDTMRGPLGRWGIMAWVIVLVVTAGGFYAIWRMFAAGDTRSLILWAGAAWFLWTVQIAVKQWIFDRMHTLSILRELKRIELRIARLERDPH